MERRRDYAAEYRARIARLEAEGFSRSQARGHARRTELTVRQERVRRRVGGGEILPPPPVIPPPGPPPGGGLDPRFFNINYWDQLLREGAFQALSREEWETLFNWWSFNPEAAALLKEIYERVVGRGNLR